MNYGLVVVAALILAGCAVALGDGATACVDFDTRSALVVDAAASSPPKRLERTADGGGINCRSGVKP